MTYNSISDISEDTALRKRITACAATEGLQGPWGFVDQYIWAFATQPGWGDAYASAQAGGMLDPGRNESVITDSQILSAVQAVIATISLSPEGPIDPE